MTVQQRPSYFWGFVLLIVLLGMTQTLWAKPGSLPIRLDPADKEWGIPVQVPYEAPPKGQDLPAESVLRIRNR